jgi:hypothetical protein
MKKGNNKYPHPLYLRENSIANTLKHEARDSKNYLQSSCSCQLVAMRRQYWAHCEWFLLPFCQSECANTVVWSSVSFWYLLSSHHITLRMSVSLNVKILSSFNVVSLFFCLFALFLLRVYFFLCPHASPCLLGCFKSYLLIF